MPTLHQPHSLQDTHRFLAAISVPAGNPASFDLPHKLNAISLTITISLMSGHYKTLKEPVQPA